MYIVENRNCNRNRGDRDGIKEEWNVEKRDSELD